MTTAVKINRCALSSETIEQLFNQLSKNEQLVLSMLAGCELETTYEDEKIVVRTMNKISIEKDRKKIIIREMDESQRIISVTIYGKTTCVKPADKPVDKPVDSRFS